MRVAVYSPYLDTAGGGEKYILSIAEVLSKDNQVDILLDDNLQSLNLDDLRKRNEDLHNLNLSKVNFIKGPISPNSNFLERFFFLKKYDWFFSNTDGSIPYSSAKNSILHFQVPFINTDAKGVWGSFRQKSWKLAICNSEFTKNIIKQTFTMPLTVIYPPVDTDSFKPLAKKNQIVNVGRFRKEKKQEILIHVFKKLVDRNKLNNWSLHIAGGVYVGDKELITKMKQLAKGYEVYFYENLSLADLAKLYGESKIYWHAAGFEETDPKAFEHFGITTVEAMSSGCIPLVINKGGQKEIVDDNINGFLWDTEEDLIKKTKKLIDDSKLIEKLSKNAMLKSNNFSKEIFDTKILELVK